MSSALRRVILVLCVAVGASACGETASAPPTPSPGMYQPSEALQPSAVPVSERLMTPTQLKRVLPRLKRNSRYSWGSHSDLVPGHLGSRLLEGKTDFDEASGRHVLTFIVNDLMAQPQRLAHHRTLPPVLNKRPGEIVKGHHIMILVGDRFEVIVRAEDASHASYEKLKYWHDQMRPSELITLANSKTP